MKKSLLAAAFLSLFLTACPSADKGTTEGTSDVINSEVIGDETSAPEGTSETTPEATTSETATTPEATTSETATAPEATASEAVKEEEKKAE